MTKYYLLSILTILILVGCNSNKTASPGNILKDSTISEEEFSGPPFSDSCMCDFKKFGQKQFNKDLFNIYLRGKDFNFEFQSCSWIFGEIIYNQDSPNSTTLVQVYLLDLDHFDVPVDSTYFGNDSIEKYVIARFYNDKENGKTTCEFDPYKTGKYRKPKHWVE